MGPLHNYSITISTTRNNDYELLIAKDLQRMYKTRFTVIQ